MTKNDQSSVSPDEAETSPDTAGTEGSSSDQPRRRLKTGAIVGLSAAGVAVLAATFVGGAATATVIDHLGGHDAPRVQHDGERPGDGSDHGGGERHREQLDGGGSRESAPPQKHEHPEGHEQSEQSEQSEQEPSN